MKVQNKDNKGNPYHDDEGKFTTGEEIYNSGDLSLDDFLNSFDENNIDSFLETIEETKPIGTFDFQPVLNKLLDNKKNKNKIIGTMVEQLKKVPDNFKKVLFDFLNKSKLKKIRIGGEDSQFDSIFHTLQISQKDFYDGEQNGHKEGTTFVHETFHAIDYLHNGNGRLSQSFVLSNGKTFRKTLDEEILSLDKTKMFQDLSNGFMEEWTNAVVKQGVSHETMLKINQINDERYTELIGIKKRAKLFPTYNDFVDEFNAAYDKYESRFEPYKKERDIVKNAKQKAILDYAIMADMCQSIDKNNDFSKLVGYGHKDKYWNQPTKQSIELFAEIAESMALNKESLEKIQKYFPNSLKAFQEIFDSLNV